MREDVKCEDGGDLPAIEVPSRDAMVMDELLNPRALFGSCELLRQLGDLGILWQDERSTARLRRLLCGLEHSNEVIGIQLGGVIRPIGSISARGVVA